MGFSYRILSKERPAGYEEEGAEEGEGEEGAEAAPSTAKRRRTGAE